MKWKSVCLLGMALVATSCAPDQQLPTGPGSPSPKAPSFVVYSPGTVTVQPTSTANLLTEGWFGYGDGGTSVGLASIGTAPATQVLGTGSLQMTNSVLGWEAAAYGSPAVAPATPLTDITTLSYATYTPSGQAGITVQHVALQFTIDYDLNDAYEGFQGRLVYEPYHCNLEQLGTWQTWNTLDGATTGCWWQTANPLNSTRAPYVGNTQQAGALPCPQGNPCTWAEVRAAYPNAGFHRINGATGVILKIGSSWQGTFYTDALMVGVNGTTKTYDFEPATQCTTTCYVNAASGDNAYGGDTPATSKKTIQAGVNQVSAGGTVVVAAGTYAENVIINKDDLTLDGAGIGTTILQGTACGGTGIALVGDRDGITIRELTATGYQYGITTGNIGNTVSNITIEDVSASSNCLHGIWFQTGVTTNVTFNRIAASSNNVGAVPPVGRGLWLINGVKSNITITDGTFNSNSLVGIDLSDGNVTGATITGNTVVGNGDAGIGVLGAKGPSANLIANNTLTNNGRYGIEIKIPTGNGLSSGAGSVVVRNNAVSRTITATDARDYAGIAVFRRSVSSLNANQPTGVVIAGNAVSGYHRKPAGSTGDGFGIVVEGTGHIVSKNIVSDNDIGIQIQDGNTANVQSTPYFDRGDATPSSALINRNSISANSSLDIRNVGAPLTDATCNWYGSAAGPLPAMLSGSLTTAPWLITSNLDGACPEDVAPVVSNVSVTPNPAPYTTASYTLTATGTDNVAVTSASYRIDGGSPVVFTFSPGSPVSLSATFGPLLVGVYDICVTAKDAANNTSNTECTMLAVYDPTAGFVTGGGWFMSPAGAYVADGGLTGRASFGFVSKYLRGRTVPTGNTEFQFQSGALNFSSTAYEWLVVNQADKNAQFKGTGTLNGVAGYKFMVWAKDGTPDTFRIQITDGAGAVVYDNKQDGEFGTTLGGGNIMIHIPRR